MRRHVALHRRIQQVEQPTLGVLATPCAWPATSLRGRSRRSAVARLLLEAEVGERASARR